MMTDFTMPSLGADMDEGTLLEWLVKPGDVVKKGDLVAVVDTSKAAVEIETFHDGVVTGLLVEPGTTVAVGTPIATMDTVVEERSEGARLETTEETVVEQPAPTVVEEVGERPTVVEEAAEGSRLETTKPTKEPNVIPLRPDREPKAGVPAQPMPPKVEAPEKGPVKISPYARRLADELGVDVEPLWKRLGRPIKEADIRAAAEQPVVEEAAPPLVEEPTVVEEAAEGSRLETTPEEEEPVVAEEPAVVEEAAPPEVEERPEGARLETTETTAEVSRLEATENRTDRMRETIARLMARSKREIPHYYLQETVDLEPALAWMHARNLELSVSDRLVPAALLLKASALAVAETPELNGFWVDGHFRPAPHVNLGVAVSLRGGGLVAPAIHDAPSLTVVELMAAMKDLVQRARAGRLRGRELTEGTITVTNLGEQGVDLVHGVIYPPQVALIGFGRPALRPWIVGGGVAPRTVTEITLAADHRATDGFVGSRLLSRIANYLLQPEQL